MSKVFIYTCMGRRRHVLLLQTEFPIDIIWLCCGILNLHCTETYCQLSVSKLNNEYIIRDDLCVICVNYYYK